jgi:type IV pilus assembly protein PilA
MRRSPGNDNGFTLVELMVVLMTMAILIALALPTYAGARQRVQDRAAQSNLRNAVTAAKTVYTDKADYFAADNAKLTTTETSLTFVPKDTSSGTSKTVSVYPGAASPSQSWYGATFSDSKTCWYVWDNAASPNGGTWWAKRTSANASTTCTGTVAGGIALANWRTTPQSAVAV